EFYPNLNLVAFVGLQAITWSKFLDIGSRTLGAGPAFSLPIFDSGRLRGNLGAKNADYDAAAEQYNQALADALREVADQVASWRSIERQEIEVAAGLAAARSAHELALARYRAGLANYLAVLATEAQLNAQRGLAVELRARRFEAAIGLAQALDRARHCHSLVRNRRRDLGRLVVDHGPMARNDGRRLRRRQCGAGHAAGRRDSGRSARRRHRF